MHYPSPVLFEWLPSRPVLRSLAALILLSSTILTSLTACAAPSSRSDTHEEPAPHAETRVDADKRYADSKFEASAEAYLQAATQAPPPDRNPLLIRAAEASLKADRRDLASQALRQLDETALTPEQRVRVDLVQANLGRLEGGPEDWLQKLPEPGKNTDADLAAGLWAARAEAHLRLGNVIDGVAALVRREALLKSSVARARNQAQIWAALQTSPSIGTQSTTRSDLDMTTRGWLDLALLQRAVWTDPADREQSLDAWEARYPRHPANDNVMDLVRDESRMTATLLTQAQAPDNNSITSSSITAPTPVYVPPQATTTASTTMTGTGSIHTLALILPLTGPLSSAAGAIRDGFMAAWFEQPLPRPRVLVFDSGRSADSALAVYERALAAGASMVVGPLSKEAVASLARMITPSQPMLALNYLDSNQPVPANFFQFGLAPEDEAQQVAQRALADGHRRAVALVPEGDWGRRTLAAFRERFESQGGKLLDVQVFPAELKDFSGPVRRLLGLGSTSTDQPAFARNPDSLPDFVFIAAQPQQGRLIRPQFRFHGAGQIPLYATSLIHEGTSSAARDNDLDDVLFCDMPFLLGTGVAALPRERLRNLWPDILKHHPRLFAFGYDAARLSLRLASGGSRDFNGVTGQLHVNEDGRVHRNLLWARFQNGLASILDDTRLFP